MRYSLDKWTKHQFLLQSGLASALPKTKRMNKSHLFAMLDQYRKVIVKPSTGSGGNGVIQLSSLDHGKYLIHLGSTQRTFQSKAKMYAYLQQEIHGKSHMVQQKISLARVQNRPFDIRVMVQRKKNTDWTVTGTLAKVAGPGYFITNIARSKGRVIPLPTAIQTSNCKVKSESALLKQVHSIALKAARQLHRYYPSIRTVGLDVGIDTRGKVWIIEANFAPNKSLFLRLKDKSMYNRILAYSPKLNKGDPKGR